MIVKTTPELAESFFEHLQILKISDFEIFVEKHELIEIDTNIFFEVNITDNLLEGKILNLVDLYGQLVPGQKSEIINPENFEKNEMVKKWNVMENFSIGFADADLILRKHFGFGIGLHPSTILTLRALYEVLSENKNIEHIVDVGSGSGILTLYAEKYSGDKIKNFTVFEIQEDAIHTMIENFLVNNMDFQNVHVNPELSQLKNLNPETTLFVANMRPAELKACENILNFGKIFIISGLMNDEENPVEMSGSKGMKFGEWRGEY